MSGKQIGESLRLSMLSHSTDTVLKNFTLFYLSVSRKYFVKLYILGCSKNP